MDNLATQLALHGSIILVLSLISGLFLYVDILKKKNEAAWHLSHAGGSARGIMLIALAAIIHLPVLPLWQLSTLVWLIIFFTWTSTLAMIIAAASGERGLRLSGSVTNKVVYVLYGVGVIAVFPAFLLLIFGLLNAL